MSHNKFKGKAETIGNNLANLLTEMSNDKIAEATISVAYEYCHNYNKHMFTFARNGKPLAFISIDIGVYDDQGGTTLECEFDRTVEESHQRGGFGELLYAVALAFACGISCEPDDTIGHVQTVKLTMRSLAVNMVSAYAHMKRCAINPRNYPNVESVMKNESSTVNLKLSQLNFVNYEEFLNSLPFPVDEDTFIEILMDTKCDLESIHNYMISKLEIVGNNILGNNEHPPGGGRTPHKPTVPALTAAAAFLGLAVAAMGSVAFQWGNIGR